MATPILRDLIGSILTSSSGGSITSLSVSAVYLTIDNTTNLALLADFSVTPTWGSAPVAGNLQLIAVDWSIAATPLQGPTPSATLLGRVAGTFSPIPTTSNSATSWVCRLNAVPLSAKTDYYLYNNATAQTISSGWVLSAQCWSPGT
jgi:hypothetical protein